MTRLKWFLLAITLPTAGGFCLGTTLIVMTTPSLRAQLLAPNSFASHCPK